MAHVYTTLADALQIGDGNIEDIIISDLLLDAPFMAALPVLEATEDFRHSYLKTVAAPDVGFRAMNVGRDNAKGTRELVEVVLSYLDASFGMDRGIYRSPSGQRLWTQEAIEHLQAAFGKIESTLFYGTGADNSFRGFADFDAIKYLDSPMTYDAGGSGNDLSSAYLVRASTADVALLGPEGKVTIEVDEPFDAELTDATGKKYNGKKTPIEGFVGLKPGGAFSVGRIANIDVSGTGLTDSLIKRARAKFPAGRKPTHLVLSEQALMTLEDSRVATTEEGKEVPTPTTVSGMKIITTDGISDSETAVIDDPS